MAVWWIIIAITLASPVWSLEVTLNTQLDKKLQTLSSSTFSNQDISVLRQLEINGASRVPEQDIRNEISVFRGDKLDPYVINRNIKRIQAMGFFHSVDSDVSDFEGGKKWVITVKENPVISAIKFTNNKSLSRDDLLGLLASKPGDIFSYSTVRRDIDDIESAYQAAGFLFTKVKKVDLPTYDNPILTFDIEESVFNEINVSGNAKTKDNVILREIDIQPGDDINENTLRRNLGRIYNLNYFSEVLPDIVPSTSTKNAYDLTINVKEKSTDSINFGGGWGQRSGGFLYSDLNINNFLGTGQLIALRGQWGGRQQSYQFKYHNPWMFGPRQSFTYRAWNTQGNFAFNNLSSSGYRPEKRYGMDVAVGLPHSYELRSTHRLKTEDVYISASDNSEKTDYSIQSYAYSLSYDTRDIIFNPLNGAFYMATVENAFKLKSNSMVFTKYDASLANFFQTFEKQTIATRLVLGRVNGDIQATEYYYIGGPNTVRGYIEYPDSFGYGKTQLFANVEYRFLLTDMFQFLFFVDAGWASSLGSDVFNGKVGKGVGFRINSPLGPIRIDFGIDESNEMRTHLNIGHIF
ncbi:MAG: BamA/OMP85 family outer membrane protein [Candidatus Marinamargulisbacteria bacterium]